MTLDDYCGGGGALWPNLTSDVFPNENIGQRSSQNIFLQFGRLSTEIFCEYVATQ